MTAAQLDRERLVKLLGMLGSAHDGEIAAAGRAADRLVRQAGLRWPDIVLPALSPPDGADSDDDPITFAMSFPDLLTGWESKFVASLARQRRPLSQKQRAVLADIVEKCHAAARTAA